jgi:hypothetical protein
MPVPTEKNKAGPYDCDGSQKEFTFDFPIIKEEDLKVIKRDIDGNEDVLIFGTDYTVSAQNNDFSNGGKITTTLAYPAGNTITLNRAPVITRTIDYVEEGKLPSKVHDDDHDAHTMAAQYLKGETFRSFKFPISDPASSIRELPSIIQRKGKYLFFDIATGEPVCVVNIEPGEVTITSFAETLLDDPDAAMMRKTLGLALDPPVGTIVAWIHGYFGDGNNGSFTSVSMAPPDNWKLCDGSELNDAESPIFNGEGRYLPNLTDDRFLMGDIAANMGAVGGDNASMAHTHTYPNHKHQVGHVDPAGGGQKSFYMYDSEGSNFWIYGDQATTPDGQTGAAVRFSIAKTFYSKTDGGGNCSGVVESLTDKNIPKYIACKYLMRVK